MSTDAAAAPPQHNQIQPLVVPALSKQGFQLARIPPGLLQPLSRHYAHSRDAALPEALTAQALAQIRPRLEEWLRQPLTHTASHGIRSFRAQGQIRPHVMPARSHVVGAMLNVGQALRAPWPIRLTDGRGRGHDIVLAEGEMLLWECARLVCSTPEPLDGAHCGILSVYYRPADWAMRLPRIQAAITHGLTRLQPPVAVREADSGLTAAECAHLMRRPGPVDEDPIVRKLSQRIAELTGLPVSHQEPVRIERYGPGEGHDTCDEGRRRFTAHVYLNDGYTGGLLRFPLMGTIAYPAVGRLVWWPNTDDTGMKILRRGAHEITPVEEGEKWAATIWVREKSSQPVASVASQDGAAGAPVPEG